jgi:citrate/tricarballylate utilization protein
MLDELFAEAQRQLTICNACRYCEGYCAVYPALERRNLLDSGDITHLANLCHDCRGCFYACMYTDPHEFKVNPPAILSTVRRESYRRFLPGPPFGGRLRGIPGATAAIAIVAAVMAIVVGLTGGVHALWPSGGEDSPYDVVPYGPLLVLILLPCLWSGAIAARALVLYWHETHGPLKELWNPRALGQAVHYAAKLQYLRGGGDECYFPDEDPSPVRRRLHAGVFYGFLACTLSTVSAGFMQDILGLDPPYPYLSVPVISGTLGGVAMVIGCTGLMWLKRRSDPVPADERMVGQDLGFLTALNALAGTGILVLLARESTIFPALLIVHLATIVVCFGIFPYTKFMHFTYRFLALVKDNLERAGNPVK